MVAITTPDKYTRQIGAAHGGSLQQSEADEVMDGVADNRLVEVANLYLDVSPCVRDGARLPT
jgi:hypothetical protein